MKYHGSRPKRFVSVALLAAAGLAAGSVARAQVPVPTAPPTASAPSCQTVDASGQPATLFGPGDRVVVKGEGFGLVSALRITFVQGTRTLSVGVAYSDELGVFSTNSADTKIPDTAQPGPASIHAFSTSKVATCAVQVMAAAGGSAAAPKPHKKRSWLIVLWVALLVVFGLFLIVVLVRRWRAKRLARSAQPAPAPTPPPGDIEPAHEDDLPILEEGPPPLAPESGPVAPLAPILEESVEPLPVRTDPARHEPLPVLDLIPGSEPGDEADREPEPETQLPPVVPPPKPSGGDELEEFEFRDGKWRLRDEPQAFVPESLRPSGVDVSDASDVADALAVPELRHRPADEPPLLDPEPMPETSDAPEEVPPRRSDPPAPVEGPVSETVARLVENTKDWTKR
jgi:hypothetical protein